MVLLLMVEVSRQKCTWLCKCEIQFVSRKILCIDFRDTKSWSSQIPCDMLAYKAYFMVSPMELKKYEVEYFLANHKQEWLAFHLVVGCSVCMKGQQLNISGDLHFPVMIDLVRMNNLSETQTCQQSLFGLHVIFCSSILFVISYNQILTMSKLQNYLMLVAFFTITVSSVVMLGCLYCFIFTVWLGWIM